MFVRKSKYFRLQDEAIDLGAEVVRLQIEMQNLKNKMSNRDAKIKDLQSGIQSLNRDLDEWEEIAHLIHVMRPAEDKSIRVPQSGIKLLQKLQKYINNDNPTVQGGHDQD